MINAPCAYQVVDSFAQGELCLSKQVRGRGLFITVKVADTDQKSINLPPTPPTCARAALGWSPPPQIWKQVNLQVLRFPQCRAETRKSAEGG